MKLDIINIKYQPDCIFYYTSDKVDSSIEVFPFTTVNRHYDKTVCIINSHDSIELGKTIKLISSFPNVKKVTIISKGDDNAELRVFTNKTEIYKIITNHGGVIIGTMSVIGGEEKWIVAFDDVESRKTAIDLLKDNTDVELSNSIELPPDFFPWLICSFENLIDFFNTLKNLKKTQKNLLKEIVNSGYYDWPRKANIAGLANEKKCTRAAVSKRIRNVERAILDSVSRFI